MSLTPLIITLSEFVIPAAVCVVAAFLVALVARIVAQQPFSRTFPYYLLFSVPVGLTGYVAGDATGISRAPAIANVVPAVLALIGGVNVYVFGTDSRFKVVVGYCVTVFTFLFFLGLQTGAYYREQEREDYLKTISEMESRIRNVRQNLDLPAEIPSWLLEDGKK